LDKHEKAIYKDIYPRLENVEKTQAEQKLQNEALKNQVKEVSLGNQDVKNTITRMSNKQDEQFMKMFEHMLKVNTMQEEVKGQLKINTANNEKEVKIARFSMKEKIILGVIAAPSLYDLLQSWGGKLKDMIMGG